MNDEDIKEIKRKQEYLKNSKYVEIRLEANNNMGELIGQDDRISYIPQKKKNVNMSEIGIRSDE